MQPAVTVSACRLAFKLLLLALDSKKGIEKINLRQLEIFKAIMDQGSVKEAAGRLNITQPSVSKHLGLLEHDVGIKLFERTGNRLIPTPEGEALYDELLNVYSGLGRLERFAQDLRHNRHGEVSVGAMPLMAQNWMPKVIGTFLKQHSQVSMALPVRSTRWIAKAVAARRLDLGIGLKFLELSGIERVPLLHTPIVCAATPDHPVMKHDVVTPSILNDQYVVTVNNFDRWRLNIERIFDEEETRPRRVVDTFTTHVACELALNGVGVALIDGLTALDYWDSGLVFRRFDPRLEFEICLMETAGWPLSVIARRVKCHILEQAYATQKEISARFG